MIFLAVCSGLDIRFRKLPFWFLLLGMVVGTVLEFCENGIGETLFWNVLPGLILLLISFLLPSQIGGGDGWMLMASGAITGWEDSLLLLEGGLLIMFPVAFFWTVIRKERKKALPFAPFMLAAYLYKLILL